MMRVKVPATSANLGVGFDCLGVALDVHATFTFTPSENLVITGCEPRFQGEDNLVWTTYLDTCHHLEVDPKPLAITIDSPIPLSGGLGSSSTCVVAGVAAALQSAGHSWDTSRALELATKAERHPDNVAPAILGGLTSSFSSNGRTITCCHSVASSLRFVVFAPPYEVRTSDARKVLPREVSLETCVWQTGHAIACVTALETGDFTLLQQACDDRVHEPFRKKLIADYRQLREAVYSAGAAAFVISGSGSTMVALCDGDRTAAHVKQAGSACVSDRTWIRVLHTQTDGTRCYRA